MIKLGLGTAPEPIFLFVDQDELQGESFLWYRVDYSKKKEGEKVPVYERALTGYLREFRLSEKEFKGKPSTKLDLFIEADELYVVRSRVDSVFSKTVLFALDKISDFSRALIFAVTPGEEKTVFCRIYDAQTRMVVRYDWDKQADVASYLDRLQSKLGTASNELPPMVSRPEPVYKNWKSPEDAIAWAQNLLPTYHRDYLHEQFDLLPGNGKKAPAWVELVKRWQFEEQEKVAIASLMPPQPKNQKDFYLAQADELIKSLGWESATVSKLIKEKYRKVSKTVLTDEELLNFVAYLQQQSVDELANFDEVAPTPVS